MRRQAIVILLLLIAPLLARAQSGPPSAPEMIYEFVPNFLKLPPHQFLGEPTGVAVNSKGHIFVFTRSAHTQLLEFRPDGNFLSLIAEDLYGFLVPHQVRVDRHDNIWTVDEGSNELVEFNPQGGVEMVLGRRPQATITTQPGATNQRLGESAAADVTPWERAYFERAFHRPTDVAWGPNGEIYVSDGYVNSRVEKFDKDGNFIKEWGQRGKGPGEFNTPHSIATDSKGNVYVVDKRNSRIQIFDSDGNFLKQWNDLVPDTLCISPPPNQVLFVIGSDITSRPIYKLDLDGSVLGVITTTGKKLGP